MSQELPVSEWDNLTPEQKHLLQVCIKSLEEAQAASVDLIKSFNDKEISSEEISTSNTGSFSENFDSIVTDRSTLPQLPSDLVDQALQAICEAKCLLAPNREKCMENCRKNS